MFASDDTINETDTKLEILTEAIRGLPYHPQITAYARLDLITARPQQLELFRQIQFRSIFFGIESFNTEASKLVRKKSGMGNNYETLIKIKQLCPNTYTVGGLIVGLNGDSEESIRQSVRKVIDDRLLSSVQLYPLSITKPEGNFDSYFASDMDKDPEKFDYQIIDVEHVHHGNKQLPQYIWQSDWTTFRGAADLTNEIHTAIETEIEDLNHLEYAGLYALGLHEPTYSKDSKIQLQSRCYSYSTVLKSLYIKQKLESFYDLSFTNS